MRIEKSIHKLENKKIFNNLKAKTIFINVLDKNSIKDILGLFNNSF